MTSLRRWTKHLLFILPVVGSPWYFGSVTPNGSAMLVCYLLVLYASVAGARLVQGRSWSLPPGAIWIALGLGYVVLQMTPLPESLQAIASPAAARFHQLLRTELRPSVPSATPEWHPLSIEPFRTETSALLLLALACAFHLANRLSRSSPGRGALLGGVAAAGVALSLFAVYQKARFGNVLYGRVPVESGTPFGPFVNHNHFAGYVEACLLVTLGGAIGASRRGSSLPLLLGGASVLIAIGHLLSHSRGGLVALVTGMATLAWLSRRRLAQASGARYLLAAGAVGLAGFLAVFAPSSLADRLASFGSAGADDSVQYRMQLWSDALGMWSGSAVFGTGFGTFAAAIPAHRSGPTEIRAEYAESDWLQILCEGGLVGLSAVLVFLVSILTGGIREAEAEPSRFRRGLAHGAIAAVVALSVHGLVDFNLRIPSNALLFAVLLGALAPAGTKLAAPRGRAGRVTAAALLALAALGLSTRAFRIGRSDATNRSVTPLLANAEELAGLVQELGASRKAVPANPETWYLLGRVYNEEAYRSREWARYRELRLSQAREAFLQALRLAPARGRYWFELAWTEANLGRDDAADRLFPLALALEPHWSNLRANYALYLLSRGRLDEALVQIERGRELQPGLTPVEALRIVGPHARGDEALLRRAAGEGPDAELALARYRAAPE